MPADQPTIVATSGAFRAGRRTNLEFHGLVRHAVDLSGVHGRRPRLCHTGTAAGDQRWFNADISEAGHLAGWEVSHLNLCTMPPTTDVPGFLAEHDVVWVGGEPAGRVGGARPRVGAVRRVAGRRRARWRVRRLDLLVRGRRAGRRSTRRWRRACCR
ncbi:hypothetical protein ACFYOT_13960 [Saccharothrix saharensis]|uniref:hypothetical protein n=1 Tax=Saccharothrix saharensis TaxID=571190 RepID=UPI0036BE711D